MVARLIGRWLVAAFVLSTVALAYIASPFVAAHALREAVKARDTATIERKVVWDSVRTSLRASLASNAQLLPEATAAGAAIKPTWWQRIKSALGASMLDRFIETYVTPEGLPKLFTYRTAWRKTVQGLPDESTLPFTERARLMFDRIKRAEFTSLTRIEIEMQDRSLSDRHYVTVMELQGWEWKLTEVSVLGGSELIAAERPPLHVSDVAKALAQPFASINPFRRH